MSHQTNIHHSPQQLIEVKSPPFHCNHDFFSEPPTWRSESFQMPIKHCCLFATSWARARAWTIMYSCNIDKPWNTSCYRLYCGILRRQRGIRKCSRKDSVPKLCTLTALHLTGRFWSSCSSRMTLHYLPLKVQFVYNWFTIAHMTLQNITFRRFQFILPVYISNSCIILSKS